MPGGSQASLLGRQSECGILERLLSHARSGQSGSLVIHGEPGVGKTALLEHVIAAAVDLTVVRVSGIEGDKEMAFAGLHHLCAPILGYLDRLPGPQSEALATVWGLSPGVVPDRFLIGLATLGLLSEAAADRPVLCVVDDAQWLDEASALTLAFVGRRLGAESVAIVWSTRELDKEHAGLPRLAVDGLEPDDARALLESVIPWPLDTPVRERIVAETRGNPLALLELPRGLSAAELAGGFGSPGAVTLTSQIEESYRRRIAQLPPEAQKLLLVASAEPTGDPALVLSAAESLGIGAFQTAVELAAPTGLLQLGAHVRFRHPLVRSAVYQAAPAQERREVHAALAEATNAESNPDRRAWHLAQAATSTDEGVAAELERSANRAQARGGVAAAAAFLERASALTSDPARRAERALAAAQAKIRVGALNAASKLLHDAASEPLDPLQLARVDLLRAQLAFVANRGSDAPLPLLRAARRLEPLDAGLARETYLDALSAAMFAAHLSSAGGSAIEVAQVARKAPPPPHSPRAPDLLLDGLTALFDEGYASSARTLVRAVSHFGQDMTPADELRWLWMASSCALHLWDDERWGTLTDRHVRLAREAGALSELPLALNGRTFPLLFAGELTAAAVLTEELHVAMEATGISLTRYAALGLAAMRGDEAATLALAREGEEGIARRGEGIGLSVTEWASAVLYNGLGRYDEAAAAARPASERPHDLGTSNWALVELIEAASRCGADDIAADAHRRLRAMTQVVGSDWALGIEARSRALVANDANPEPHYQAAIARLSRTRLRCELARAHLLYGEWLGREQRRVDASAQLRTAYTMLTQMDVVGFADRARRALLATGTSIRRSAPAPKGGLTAQERQIARLVCDGLSNPEIAARLFISPRTVKYHLHKVFSKLGITSRRELEAALLDASAD
jgi:DNA-binding CsgD family transcriptional regulator